MIIRKRIKKDGIIIKSKNRRGLKETKRFLKNFNIWLFLQDVWIDNIIYGFNIVNFEETKKNDRYQLDK